MYALVKTAGVHESMFLKIIILISEFDPKLLLLLQLPVYKDASPV
jgi:hypothetical protein